MLELAAIVLTFGAVLYHSVGLSFYTIALLSFSGVLLASFFFRTKQGILFSFLFGLIFIFGALTVQQRDVSVPKDTFGNRSFDAQVVSVDRRLTRTLLVVRENNNRYQVSVTESVALPGDVVLIQGAVVEPESFITANGRLFDYPRYLESKGIVAVVNNATVTIEKEGDWSLGRFATTLRFSIAAIFSHYISFPVDGVVAGMLVGYQGGLPQSIQDLFRTTGVLHVLVLSGYNITLLAGFLSLLLKPLPFKSRTFITIIAIILLVLISGSGIASVRAGIMGSIALFAGLVQRTYQPLRALTFAYLLFFFISPGTIFSDPGFHLSFLATMFMILVLPKVEQVFHFLPVSKGINIREISMLALCVPLFMLPYTMYFSGNFPLASPFSNMLLAILTPVIMILGTVVLTVSVLVPFANIIGSVLSFLGMTTVSLLHVFDRLPNWNTPQLPWWGVTLFYMMFLCVLFQKELMLYVLHLQNSLLPASNSAHSENQ